MYPNVSLSNREHVGGVLPCCARLLNIQTELALHGNVTTLKIVILPQFNQCLCDCASSSLHIFAVRKDAYRGQQLYFQTNKGLQIQPSDLWWRHHPEVLTFTFLLTRKQVPCEVGGVRHCSTKQGSREGTAERYVFCSTQLLLFFNAFLLMSWRQLSCHELNWLGSSLNQLARYR